MYYTKHKCFLYVFHAAVFSMSIYVYVCKNFHGHGKLKLKTMMAVVVVYDCIDSSFISCFYPEYYECRFCIGFW